MAPIAESFSYSKYIMKNICSNQLVSHTYKPHGIKNTLDLTSWNIIIPKHNIKQLIKKPTLNKQTSSHEIKRLQLNRNNSTKRIHRNINWY